MPGLSDTQGSMQSRLGLVLHLGALMLFSHSDSDIEEIWQLSWRTSFYRGGPVFMSALSGIDIALWDLKGRRSPWRWTQV